MTNENWVSITQPWYQTKSGINFAIAVSPDIDTKYFVFGYPTYIVVDPNGVVQWNQSGSDPSDSQVDSWLASNPGASAPTITTSTISSPWPEGSLYPATTFAATGGTGNLSWSATGLPAGLSMSSSGVLSGTPASGSNSATPYSIVVTVTDSATTPQSDTANFSLTISAPAGGPAVLAITTASLPVATYNIAYSKALAASGGTSPYVWTVTGTLPAGLTANAGVISGTPQQGSEGQYPLTITVTDSAAGTASKALTMTVRATAPLSSLLGGAGGGGMMGCALTQDGNAPWFALALLGILGACCVAARRHLNDSNT